MNILFLKLKAVLALFLGLTLTFGVMAFARGADGQPAGQLAPVIDKAAADENGVLLINKTGGACDKQVAQLNDAFTSLSTQFAGDTTLVTSEIFKGYTPFSRKRSGGIGLPKALGLRATASVPALNSTQREYANTTLQLQDGALVGLTFSFMGSPYWGHWYAPDCEMQETRNWAREFSPDRTYLARHPVVEELTKFYFIHGFSMKAIREVLVESEGAENNSSEGISGAGTFYAGLGFDGPIGLFGNDKKPGSIGGTLDINAGWNKTWIRTNTLRVMYEDESIDVDTFETLFVKMRVQITDKFHIDLEHVSPQGKVTFMDNVTSFRLGYSLE